MSEKKNNAVAVAVSIAFFWFLIIQLQDFGKEKRIEILKKEVIEYCNDIANNPALLNLPDYSENLPEKSAKVYEAMKKIDDLLSKIRERKLEIEEVEVLFENRKKDMNIAIENFSKEK
ncbi:MAG: hypothetical protein PHH17_01570 [Candidatus Pacebacteria bacterium]|nr:hypothetical protein [Candidatus Paceibacterota bacterium]MDD5445882.1 hypothetical protein [Candidatus Paceibacterota bacterium]